MLPTALYSDNKRKAESIRNHAQPVTISAPIIIQPRQVVYETAICERFNDHEYRSHGEKESISLVVGDPLIAPSLPPTCKCMVRMTEGDYVDMRSCNEPSEGKDSTAV